ncbi:hypothetical protein HPB52_017994 [Rhipicephalus sanguineus]|uniref:G-protein coupled receptors family 2 profile 2 domain-containing protein n=1 Tax=Rhipicephalus sanguineus TaxID=34632 RepID=A0A9D4Q1I0_RHISA|nr:hypothetical protein HPB52_017994 [Rhipicephalus sanguineus]
MKTLLTLLLLLWTSVLSGGGTFAFHVDCNVTLPWSSAKAGDHDDVPEDLFEELLRCPAGLNGCASSPVECALNLFAVTCSCASNCEAYGDCCWEAGSTLARPSAAECVTLNIKGLYDKDIYVVTGCNREWPRDQVRDACENVDAYNDTYYGIPVTSARNVTYMNAFCALCNYDLDETTTFWNSTGASHRSVTHAIPSSVERNGDNLLRPCARGVEITESCPEASYLEYKRSTKAMSPTWFTRISTARLCHGVEASQLECAPLEVVPDLRDRPRLRSFLGPNLVSLFKPVVSSDSCFSWHGDKCYIRAPDYRYANVTTEDETMGRLKTNATTATHWQRTACVLSYHHLPKPLPHLPLPEECRVRVLQALSDVLVQVHPLSLGNFVLEPVDFPSGEQLQVLALILHYGFLSTFFWTSVLSFDIWKNVAAVVHLPSGRHGCGFHAYCLIAWGAPLVIAGLCAILNWTVPPTFPLSPRYGRFGCWIGTVGGQAVFFLLPMMLLLLLDLCLYAHIVIHIHNTSSQTAGFDFKGGGQRSHMALFVKLALIMGTTWVLGFVGAFVDVVAVDIIVIVLVGLQGVYLFFGFRDYRHFLPKRFFRKDLERTTSGSSGNTVLAASVTRDPNGSIHQLHRKRSFDIIERPK